MTGLQFGPLGDRWVHLGIDMQRMFAEPTEWHTPWMQRLLLNVVTVVELDPGERSSRGPFLRGLRTTPAAPGDGIIASGK